MRGNVFAVIGVLFGVFAAVSMVTGQQALGIGAAAVALGIAKWGRMKRLDSKDEIEYDERVNENIHRFSFHAFAFSNLLLLIYLFVADQIMHEPMVEAANLIWYLSVTFITAFYIVPLIARKL